MGLRDILNKLLGRNIKRIESGEKKKTNLETLDPIQCFAELCREENGVQLPNEVIKEKLENDEMLFSLLGCEIISVEKDRLSNPNLIGVSIIRSVFENKAIYEKIANKLKNGDKKTAKEINVKTIDFDRISEPGYSGSTKYEYLLTILKGAIKYYGDLQNVRPEISERISEMKEFLTLPKDMEELIEQIPQILDNSSTIPIDERIQTFKKIASAEEELFKYYIDDKNLENLKVLLDTNDRQSFYGFYTEEQILEKFVTSTKTPGNDELNPELVALVEKYIPEKIDGHDITDTERAIAIYHILCNVLTYDVHVNVDDRSTFGKHKEKTKISEVTPENNEIICSDFAKIYSLFLEKYNIPHEIKYRVDLREGNVKSFVGVKNLEDVEKVVPSMHQLVMVKTDGVIFMADSTKKYGFDLASSCLGTSNKYSGIILVTDESPEKKETFSKSVQGVINAMKNVEIETPTRNLVNAYRNICDAKKQKTMNPNEQVKFALETIKNVDGISETDKWEKTKDIINLVGGQVEYVNVPSNKQEDMNKTIGIIKYPLVDSNGKEKNNYCLYDFNRGTLTYQLASQVQELLVNGTLVPMKGRETKSKLLNELICVENNKIYAKPLDTKLKGDIEH